MIISNCSCHNIIFLTVLSNKYSFGEHKLSKIKKGDKRCADCVYILFSVIAIFPLT